MMPPWFHVSHVADPSGYDHDGSCLFLIEQVAGPEFGSFVIRRAERGFMLMMIAGDDERSMEMIKIGTFPDVGDAAVTISNFIVRVMMVGHPTRYTTAGA